MRKHHYDFKSNISESAFCEEQPRLQWSEKQKVNTLDLTWVKGKPTVQLLLSAYMITFNLTTKACTFSNLRAKSSYCNAVTFSDEGLGFDRILETWNGAQQPTNQTGWYVMVCLDEPDKISCVVLVSRGVSTSLAQCTKIWERGWSVVWVSKRNFHQVFHQNIHQDSAYTWWPLIWNTSSFIFQRNQLIST